MPNIAAEPAGAPVLDIAVGVLVDAGGRLLIAKRRPGTPGAGYWEFPGGKREGEEPIADCLARELAEEIGVRIDFSAPARSPLITFSHARGEKPVRLHVWRIDAWQGEARGVEGQSLAWVERAALADYELLPATDVILNALFLPSAYLITPAYSAAEPARWWAALDRALADGCGLLRLRDLALDDTAYAQLAETVIARAHTSGARVLVDRDAESACRLGADGLHWPVARLIEQGRPPMLGDGLLAVSAHTASDLAEAVARGADFATLSPVAATPSHPGQAGLGWARWQVIRGDHGLPVYALGGLGRDDIALARERNAQGVAAIRGYWPPA